MAKSTIHTVRINVKCLEIWGPDIAAYAPKDPDVMPYFHKMAVAFDEKNQEVLDRINWDLVADAVSDQLPKGFSVKLRN